MENYFQTHNDYFWQWEDNETVISIPNGNTIAYRNFLGEIIENLSPQGLPPFGSLLLAIMATNPDSSNAINTVNRIITTSLKTTDDVELERAISFLKILGEIPSQYKQGNKRMTLLQILFENCHNVTSVKNAKKICEHYKNNVTDHSTKQEFNKSQVSKDFKTIGLLRNRFETSHDIIEKLGSGHDLTQYELNFDPNPGREEGEPLDLIDELVTNEKTFVVGSLIRRLWGGLNIPVHSSFPSQQALGGVSDLTNKGDFDKLLISEFANDDVVFMSRLANNEALYIHREVPPTSSNLHRIILIDASLKNWGTPKAIAFSVMLAIAKHPKTDIGCSAFVVGDNCYPVRIDSVDGIVEGIQMVEGCLTCAQGLEIFFKEHSQLKNREIFFLTESSTIRYAPLLKVLNQYNSSIHYLVLTDADGNIDVYKKNQNSKKHLQHINLPLHELWKKRPKVPVPERTVGTSEFPLLFKKADHSKKLAQAPDGAIFFLSIERALFRLFNNDKNKGWELMAHNLSSSLGDFEMGISDGGDYILLLFNRADKSVMLLNINTREKKSVVFNEWKSTAEPSFVFHKSKFFHRSPHGTYSIDLEGSIVNGGDIDDNVFVEKQNNLKELDSKYSASSGVAFKNINRVFINERGNLVFNIHELHLSENKTYLKLLHSKKIVAKIDAKKSNDSDFVFEDGSIIEINRNGMMILKSSNRSIPSIYIPTSLDKHLGVATDQEFSGNEYFYKDPQYEVILKNAGENVLAVVKQLKVSANLSLKDSKEIVDQVPARIMVCFQNKAKKVKAELEAVGAVVELLIPESSSGLEKISPEIFYNRYIKIFVDNIQQHGTKD